MVSGGESVRGSVPTGATRRRGQTREGEGGSHDRVAQSLICWALASACTANVTEPGADERTSVTASCACPKSGGPAVISLDCYCANNGLGVATYDATSGALYEDCQGGEVPFQAEPHLGCGRVRTVTSFGSNTFKAGTHEPLRASSVGDFARSNAAAAS